MAQTAAYIYLKHQENDNFEILCQKPQVSTGQTPSQQAEDPDNVLTWDVLNNFVGSFAFGEKKKKGRGFP